MLKGFFYRRAPEGATSGTDVSIRFEINSKESILAKTTNLSSDGMQFLLPRGKVILVPDERIMLILNHPEHGEFKIQSEVYYFCNTTDLENNPVVCYGVKFIELSPATWDMVQDYCGTHFPEVTFTPRIQPGQVKIPPLPVPDKAPIRSERPSDKHVSPPGDPVFTPIAPVKIPIPPIPSIMAAPPPTTAPVFSVEPPVTVQPIAQTLEQPANQPSVAMNPTPVIPAAVPKVAVTSPSPVESLEPAVKPQVYPEQNPAIPEKNPAATSKRKTAPGNPDNPIPAAALPNEQPETPVQNSIQALAASLAAPPVSSSPAKAQSMSQEMIDRLIEKLQAESKAESQASPAQIYDSLPKPQPPVNPNLDQLMVTENELNSVKTTFNEDPTKADSPIGIEYLKSVQSINADHEKSPFENFLIINDPFDNKASTAFDRTEPFTKPTEESHAAGVDLTLTHQAIPPAASLGDAVNSTEKTLSSPPIMAGTSLVDLIMDMDATIQKAGATLSGTQKEHTLSNGVPDVAKPEPKKNPVPTISFEELSKLNPQSAFNPKSDSAPKEKPVTKAAEGLPVIPPITPAASGISMDQKAIDKLVQTLIQEQSLSETASVAENIKPSNTSGHTVTAADKKAPEPKINPFLQSTILGGQATMDKPAAVPHPTETKPAPAPWSTHPQPGNAAGVNILIPDPNNTRVMDQKSIDIIVQTLTQENAQSNTAPAPIHTSSVPPTAPAVFNQTPVKPFVPVESKRTLDQKAIDQVVQALTQSHAAKSSLTPETAVNNTKTYVKEFGSTATHRTVEPTVGKEKKPALSLATLAATLYLENGTILQCTVEQVYVGGLMVRVDQDLPLNSALKISITGDGTRITDIQGTCTNCEPGRSGKSGFLAEIFFKNLSNTHMEQFRTLIAKLDTK